MKKINQALIDEAVRLYVSGETLDECSRRTSVSETTLRRNLTTRGIPCRNNMRFIPKVCFCCNETYLPTGSRQIVCARPSCQEWRANNRHLAPRLLAEYAPHGTMRKYVSGCKCDDCKDANNNHKRIDRHQMYPQDYAALLDIQGGACALCGGSQIHTARAFDVDHSHACTEHDHQRSTDDQTRQSCQRCWRGLLCRTCNQQLERKVGHAYIRDVEGCASAEDRLILEYIRNPPADRLRSHIS